MPRDDLRYLGMVITRRRTQPIARWFVVLRSRCDDKATQRIARASLSACG